MNGKNVSKNGLVFLVAATVMFGITNANADHKGFKHQSGYDFLSEESKAMQDDDFENPGSSTVDTGAEMFVIAGKNGKSCASCHGEDGGKLDIKDIAMYPVYDKKLKRPITLQQKIRMEWENRLGNKALKYDGKKALALEVFVRNLARGEKVNVKIDGPMKPFFEKGKAIYHKRSGQLNMSCTQCHDTYYGKHIRANLLSQGQSNGYPAYRLKNGKINGLHSRFNGCYKNIRAEKSKPGNDDYVALEVYLGWRGNGLPIEAPGIRF